MNALLLLQKILFLLEKKHDKACIYCYILLQSFPRMNYFNTTILLICSYICHHKQLKQGNLRLKNTDKELCFLQRHVPGYLTNWKRTQKLIFQCFPCIYVKRKLQHQESYYLSCTCQCVLQYIRWKQYSANCCSSYSSKECAPFSCLNSSITENHNNILYANLKKKIELNGKINKYE